MTVFGGRLAPMTTTTPTSTPAPRRAVLERPWPGFMVVLAASVMDLLDSTITQTAAPAIRRELGGSYADLEWFTAAYTLAMSAALLPAGRLGDALGRRRVLLAGIGGFALCSLLCALAPAASTLILARALQGALGATMVVQGFGIIRELFGDEGQRRAFGIFGPVMGLAAVAGPLIGGGLVDLDLFGSGWRAIFLVNLPVALAALGAGARWLPRRAPAAPGLRLDPAGLALAVAGAVALVYPLIEGRQQGWPAWCFALIAAGVALLGAFGARQAQLARGGRRPLIEPRI